MSPIARQRQTTRLETFVDAAFAFTLTMLVISVGSIPRSFDELLQALKGVPAFAASFAIMIMFWLGHYRWSRRYGIEDTGSVVLSLLLVFLVLVFLYPLRLMMSGALSAMTGGWLPAEFLVSELAHARAFFGLYGLAFALMAATLLALNRQLPTPPIIRTETFHQNTITLTGTVQAVCESVDHNAASPDPDIVLTLAVTDRYAPLARRDPTPTRNRPAHTITLRLPQGKPLNGRPLSLSPRQRVRVTGYLRDHAEALSLFRVWASLKLFERLQADDGQRLLKSNDTHVIVEALTPLPDPLAPNAFDENTLIVSGIAQRIWTTRSTLRSGSAAPDVCVRLATYS